MENAYHAPQPPHRAMPDWVPASVKTYLAHLEGGDSLRHIARTRGVHASTILRQVRRTEELRDDPLADAALSTLEKRLRRATPARLGREETRMSLVEKDLDEERLKRDMLRALKALSEPKALLVIAEGVEDAVIVVNDDGDRPVRRAVISRDVAEVMALREVIEGRMKGRLGRYAITAHGRAELNKLMAGAESARLARPEESAARGPAPRKARRRTAGVEAPLRVLARRKRRDGEAFLSADLVAAAERFHESYEIARVSGALNEDDLPKLLADRIPAPVARSEGGAALALSRGELALAHLVDAVRVLGPEMAQTVVMGVCREWGMERIEEELEYPARSGKIVLRIALKTLARHYARVGVAGHDLIY